MGQKCSYLGLAAKSANQNPGFPPEAAPLRDGSRAWSRLLEAKVLALLPAVSLAFMIYSSATAIYQSKGDPGTVAFVAGSLSILGALYYCMQEFERASASASAARRERFKLAIWLLAVALNTLFSYRVTSVIDSTVFSAIIWSIAAVTTVLGCYLMFFSGQDPEAAAAPAPVVAAVPLFGCEGKSVKVNIKEINP